MAKRIRELRILCRNANGVYNEKLALQEIFHSLDIDIALIRETKLLNWFEWRNPGCRKYNTRDPNEIYGRKAVLVRSNI
jgi:hypothetical protein